MTQGTVHRLQRRFERVPVTLLATVEADVIGRLRACVVQDYTEHGAKLVFPVAPVFPSTVQLRILRLERIYWAQVRWQNGQMVGVAFVAQVS